jgi:hypothetical protein
MFCSGNECSRLSMWHTGQSLRRSADSGSAGPDKVGLRIRGSNRQFEQADFHQCFRTEHIRGETQNRQGPAGDVDTSESPYEMNW